MNRAALRIVLAALGVGGICATAAMAGQQAATAGPSYKVVGKWGKDGSGNGQFRLPKGIAVDKGGNVYVADTDNNRIQVFSAKGAFLRKWGSVGGGNGQFQVAEDLDLAPDGTVWVADQQNSRLQQFSSSGAFMSSISVGLELPRGIAVDAKGDVLAAVEGTDTKSGFRRFTKSASGWQETGGRMGAGEYRIDEIEASRDGTVYLTTTKTNPPYDARIRRYSAGGQSLGSFKRVDTTPGIGIDLDCNIWSPDITQRRIVKYSPSGRFLATASVPDLIAEDIAVGPTGDLYVIHQNVGIVHFAEDRSKPATAAVPGKITVSKGKATIKYTASRIACPVQVDAVARLAGKGVSGRVAVKVAAGKATAISMPVKAPAGKSVTATFKIVLKTNGRSTTETRKVTVSVKK